MHLHFPLDILRSWKPIDTILGRAGPTRRLLVLLDPGYWSVSPLNTSKRQVWESVFTEIRVLNTWETGYEVRALEILKESSEPWIILSSDTYDVGRRFLEEVSCLTRG